MTIDHVFVSYSRDYRNITVRQLTGDFVSEIFQSWLPGLEERYGSQESNRRYRKSISYKTVITSGQVVMSVQDGMLTP